MKKNDLKDTEVKYVSEADSKRNIKVDVKRNIKIDKWSVVSVAWHI